MSGPWGSWSTGDQPALLAAATAVPIPQLRTPFAEAQVPAKLLDALAMQVPVAASRVGDLPEILGDGTDAPRGWLYEPGDARGLAAALQAIAGDPADRARRTKAARDWFLQNASASATRGRLMKLVHQACERTNGSPLERIRS